MESKLTEKIQKLLSLANSNVEAEAKSAMLRAQALMAEHDLSMEQVQTFSVEEENVEEMTVPKDTRNVQWWQKQLSIVIAENFRCKVLLRSYGYTRNILLIGMPEDVKVATETLQFAFASALNCWNKYRKGRDYPSRKITEAAKREFMGGFAKGLRDAFHEQVKERALVLVTNPKVDQYMKSLDVHTEPTKRYMRGDADARQNGYAEGRRLNNQGSLLAASPV